jgi:hypothetical protein
MTWTKTGDEFADECWTLSDAAYRLHHEGLTWSNRKGSDGRLIKEDMVRWAKRPAAADELVSIGWWEDSGEHYKIIHHIGYQRTRDQVAKQSIANQKNAARRWKKSDKSESQCESQCGSTYEMDRTGQDRQGLRESKKNGQNNNNNNGEGSADFARYRARAHEDVNPEDWELAIRRNLDSKW